MNASPTFDHPHRRALQTIADIVRSALADAAPVSETAYAPEASGHAANAASASSATERARGLYAARRRRDRAFGAQAVLFGDPAWDILLDLFVAQADDRRVSVTSACIAACVPPTTALRWIETLYQQALVERIPDAGDRRRHYLRLTAAGARLVAAAIREP